MLNSRYTIFLIAAIAVLLPNSLRAETLESPVNTFSSYSMYGIGELQTKGTISTRSMGGAGVALRSSASINLLNPASYSVVLQRSVLFDYGVEGGTYFAKQSIDGTNYKDEFSTANFRDIALQMPIAKGWGVGFSVTPYSSVGYSLSSSSIDPDWGYIKNAYYGSGDISEVKLGVGWEIKKGLSVGFAALYYWGDLDRNFDVEVTNIIYPGDAVSSSGVDNLSVSNIKAQVGVQWDAIATDRRRLTLGATYDLGGDLSPRYVRAVKCDEGYEDVFAQNDTTSMSLHLPREIAIGANYTTHRWVLAADFSYQNWASENSGTIDFTNSGMDVAYNNIATLKVGMEYTPRRSDVRRYYNRMNYRFGARYGGYQYTFGGETLTQYAITAGVGLPINMIGISKVDVGFEFGGVGDTRNVTIDNKTIGLIQQNYVKLSLGFTMFGDDYWFQRPQID